MKTLVLTQSEVKEVTTMELAVTAVEGAFAGFGRGEASMPPKVYLPIEDHDGDFRAMPARLGDSAGIKWVNVHAHNRKRYGLPTVMAVYVLNDPANAFPLAVMDGTLLTALRTGAAGAIASKHLAQRAPRTISFIGCGTQAYTLHGSHQVVFDGFESLAHDRNDATARRFAERVGARVVSLEDAAGADIVCTATPSRTPFLQAHWVKPGAHINAMGADAPGKRELCTATLKEAAVYIDDIHKRLEAARSTCLSRTATSPWTKSQAPWARSLRVCNPARTSGPRPYSTRLASPSRTFPWPAPSMKQPGLDRSARRLI